MAGKLLIIINFVRNVVITVHPKAASQKGFKDNIQVKMQQNAHGEPKERKKKESILDLSKYLEKNIRVKFAGGREAAGILKGYDPLLNLVLDNTTEYLRDPDDPYKLNQDTRMLGLVVCRGTSVVLICPVDGMESIQNPFIQQEG
ncbi:U6 snRNA-associated Sm protein LSm7 [Apis cerana cerana]|uniref:U6 snRNA-associated Sm-like protein LSm7 n=1 Tax=Apis cerana cerana TaxID=94128 RepID=A0A2A3ELA0_APICC|nr:U6 snRNA-associated Sm protein LSm7 [Apis cerana cerana]